MRVVMMRGLSLLLVVLLLAGCGAFKRDDASKPAALTSFEAERRLARVWSRNIGDGQGGIYNRLVPALAGDRIVVASANGRVQSLDRRNGRRQWQARIRAPLSGGVGLGHGLVLLGSSDGRVFALDDSNGELLWEVDVRGEVLAPPATDGVRVVVQTFDGRVLGLDVTDGRRLWSHSASVPALTLRGTSTPMFHQGAVLVGLANGRVISLDAGTGSLRWEQRVGVPQGTTEIERLVDVDGELLVSGGVLYAVSYQGQLMAIDPASGRRLWSREASSHAGLAEGFANIYVVGHEGSVTAFLRNGEGVRWEQTVLSRRRLTGPATWDGYVAVGDFKGYLHLLSQRDGSIAARTRVHRKGLRARPEVVEDMLYIYSNSGRLVAYRMRE